MYRIDSTIILPSKDQCYQNIITIHPRPNPNNDLYQYVRSVHTQPLSKFDYANKMACTMCNTSNCLYAVINPETNKPFCIHEMTEFLNLITTLGYSPDYSLTKIMEKKQLNGSSNLIFYMIHKN